LSIASIHYLYGQFFLFLWWSGFETQTLHILYIIHNNWAKLTKISIINFKPLKNTTNQRY